MSAQGVSLPDSTLNIADGVAVAPVTTDQGGGVDYNAVLKAVEAETMKSQQGT